MNRRRRDTALDNPVLLGGVIVLMLLVTVYISYGADRGLPFVPTYELRADVPDAAKLLAGDEVRIGGARVGIIKKVAAVPGNPPYAELTLGLAKGQRLPIDSTVQVRPRSILGAKYLAVTRGHSNRFLAAGTTLGLDHASGTVEIDDAFKAFDQGTRSGLEGTIQGFGDSFAARGADLNQALGSTAALLAPFERVLGTLVAPATHLAGFIDASDSFMGWLAPVSNRLGGLVAGADGTLAALARSRTALGQTLDALPPTETQVTGALQTLTPVLADTAAIARAVRPGTRLLPRAAARLATALRAGTPALARAGRLPPLLGDLSSALAAAVPPRSSTLANSLHELEATVSTLGPALRKATPAQTACNIAGQGLRNFASTMQQGDPSGSWLTVMVMLDPLQGLQGATPDPRLHSNTYPREDASACQAGNELFTPGQRIGSPLTAGSAFDPTAPPASASAAARRAGLLAPTPGARP